MWASLESHGDRASAHRSGRGRNTVGNEDDTALIWASNAGHTEIVQALIAAGADLDATDLDGSTALIWQRCGPH